MPSNNVKDAFFDTKTICFVVNLFISLRNALLADE